MRELIMLQTRFERRSGRRALRLLEHPRFRAAYDFLLLRAAAGEVDPELAAVVDRPAADARTTIVSRWSRTARCRSRSSRPRARPRAGVVRVVVASLPVRPDVVTAAPGAATRRVHEAALGAGVRGARQQPRASRARRSTARSTRSATLPQTRLVLRSPRYRSRPLGPVEQPDFVNAVAALLTQLDPATLLRRVESARIAARSRGAGRALGAAPDRSRPARARRHPHATKPN